jgi:DNA-binding LytR/AlgR family response regulator
MQGEGQMIRIGICDDEMIVHDQVKKSICGHDFGIIKIEPISFMNGQELLEYDQTIDILLLDICMPGLDGIEIGQRLKKNRTIGKIIMLTSMVERFQEAFEIEAYRFVTKPIDEDKLIKAIEDAMATFIGTEPIEVFLENVKYSFQQKEICYVSKAGSRTEVVVGSTMFQSELTLGEWNKVLDERMFFQIHKSYIVNLGKIEAVEEKIRLQSGEKLPVAKRRRTDLMKHYMQYDLRYR